MITKVRPTIEDIQISDYELVCYLLKQSLEIPCVIRSPFRIDSNPSFSIYLGNDGKLKYMDFGTHESGGIIDLAMKVLNLSFTKTIEYLVSNCKDIKKETLDFKKDIRKFNTSIEKIKRNSEDFNINVKTREWKKWDIEFWKKYGISLRTLNICNVYPISHIFYMKNGKEMIISAEKYAYCYVEFKDNITSFKIYQPYSEKYKWINTNNSSVWELWEQLPTKGETLIITKSRKDAMCIMENWKIPSCSLQAEGYIPKKQVIEELKSRFKNIYLLYDNDFDKEENYGRIFGKKISEKFNIKQVEIPEKYQVKDCSDFIKVHGIKEFKKLWKEILM